jgi:hypothetical protein
LNFCIVISEAVVMRIINKKVQETAINRQFPWTFGFIYRLVSQPLLLL